MESKIRLALVTPMLLALGFCSTMPTGTLCSVGPFIGDPGASQRLSRSEKEYVVSLNESGQQICGWSPPSATK